MKNLFILISSILLQSTAFAHHQKTISVPAAQKILLRGQGYTEAMDQLLEHQVRALPADPTYATVTKVSANVSRVSLFYFYRNTDEVFGSLDAEVLDFGGASPQAGRVQFQQIQ